MLFRYSLLTIYHVLLMLPLLLQGEYGSAGLEASYSGGQAAFASAYGGQVGYPSAATGASGRDAYGGTNLYSQGFAAGSQVPCKLVVVCLQQSQRW